MKRIIYKLFICLMILAFGMGFQAEASLASNHKLHSCCSADKSHSNAKCHSSPKVCVCGHQQAQVCLFAASILPAPVFTGYISLRTDFTYLYLFTEDIFHPPKA